MSVQKNKQKEFTAYDQSEAAQNQLNDFEAEETYS